jgi:Ca-activated chloride channel family protein
MTFAAPVLLAGLVLVPIAAVAYVRAQRRRRRYAMRYTNVDLLAEVVARDRTRHLRHVPALVMLLAIAALAIALARPQHRVIAEVREATVVMVTDISGSMEAQDVEPTRLAAARDAARSFAQQLPDDLRLGLVTFGSVAEQQVQPTTDHAQVIAAINRLRATGATAMGDGLALGLRSARAPAGGAGRGSRLPSVLVLLSDGKNTRGTADPVDVARATERARVRIFTLGLGTPGGVLIQRSADGRVRREPVPPDYTTLRTVAQLSGGRFFAAPDAGQLKRAYDGLGRGLTHRRETREITATFAGAALALILTGAILSLLRTGRLP